MTHVRMLPLLLALVACGSPAPETPPGASPSPAPGAPAAPAANATGESRRVDVHVDAQGYHPSTIEVHANEAVTLVVTRTTDEGCGQQLAIPDLGIRRDLPLDTPVEIMIRPTHGPIRFTCGMNMLEGTIVVK